MHHDTADELSLIRAHAMCVATAMSTALYARLFPGGRGGEILQENSIPTNYVIDAQGTIIIKETGAADWNSSKVRNLLNELLAK